MNKLWPPCMRSMETETYINELVNKIWHGATVSWNDIQGLRDLVCNLVNCVMNPRPRIPEEKRHKGR